MLKRLLLSFVLFAVLLSFAPYSQAEGPLTSLCDSFYELLFETRNVTVTGEAVFSLDGERFKTAKAEYVQDGDRSLWDLKLFSPRADGTERENGYTIIADGAKVYVMEVYRPGVYKTGTITPQSTIVRASLEMDLMKRLLRSVAGETESIKDSGTVRIEENNGSPEIRIELHENIPATFNLSMNILARYIARRYFDVDSDKMFRSHAVPMGDYLTVTEGILSCTESAVLEKASVSIRKDQEGKPEHISGDVSIRLNTVKDGERLLSIAMNGEISERGTSHVDAFSPADYNVRLADGAMNIEDIEFTEVDELTQEKLTEQAKKTWTEAGYELDRTAYGYSYKQKGRYCTELSNAIDNISLVCTTNAEGKILELRSNENLWQEKSFNYEDPCPDMQLAESAADKVMEYLERVNPEDCGRIKHLKLQCWYEEDDGMYLEFCEDPIAQDWDGVLIVVCVRPDWKVLYYSCFSNG